MKKNDCQYAEPEILAELKTEGLRLAKITEAGWFWTCYDRNDERVTLWVTDAKGA